jgi:hypothetical protein
MKRFMPLKDTFINFKVKLRKNQHCLFKMKNQLHFLFLQTNVLKESHEKD